MDDGLSGRLDLGELDKGAGPDTNDLDRLDLSEFGRVRLDLLSGKGGLVGHAVSGPVGKLESALVMR